MNNERVVDAKINVVVVPLTPSTRHGSARVDEVRVCSRRALQVSAKLSQAELRELCKDDNDAPLPSNGWYWSLSHCRTHVAAAVHRWPLGVDVESSRAVTPQLVDRVLTPDEQAILLRGGESAFLRGWTAKEAVLKELGLGLSGLSRCTIVACEDDELMLECDGERRRVRQLLGRERIVALSARDGAGVEWCNLGEMPTDLGDAPWT